MLSEGRAFLEYRYSSVERVALEGALSAVVVYPGGKNWTEAPVLIPERRQFEM